MAWGRIDDGAFTHRKFLGLDPSAVGLWAMALSYCNHHLTDGLIPRAQVPRLVAVSAPKAHKLAGALVAAGLWEDWGKDGFHVHDYLDWNDSASDIRKKRENARARKERHRSRVTGRYGNTSQDVEGTRESHPPTPLHATNPPIVPPSSGVGTSNGEDLNATPRAWLPKHEWIFQDGCAKREFAHFFPEERRAQCPRHQAGEAHTV